MKQPGLSLLAPVRSLSLATVFLVLTCGATKLNSAGHKDADSPQQTKPADPVTVGVKVGRPTKDGSYTLVIEMQLQEGWKVYGHPLANEDMKHLELQVIVKGS